MSSSPYILLVRHGERQDNMSQNANAPPEGDTSLTDSGKELAKELPEAHLAQLLVKEHQQQSEHHHQEEGVQAGDSLASVPPAEEESCCVPTITTKLADFEIFSSPFLRCRQTAECLSQGGVGRRRDSSEGERVIRIDNRLGEVYGPVRIKTESAPHVWQPESIGRRAIWPESLEEARDRFRAGFKAHLARLIAQQMSTSSSEGQESNNNDNSSTTKGKLKDDTAYSSCSSCLASCLVSHGDAIDALYSWVFPSRMLYDVSYLGSLLLRVDSSSAAEIRNGEDAEENEEQNVNSSNSTRKVKISIVGEYGLQWLDQGEGEEGKEDSLEIELQSEDFSEWSNDGTGLKVLEGETEGSCPPQEERRAVEEEEEKEKSSLSLLPLPPISVRILGYEGGENIRLWKLMILCRLLEIEYTFVNLRYNVDNLEKSFLLNCHPMGRSPVLETDEGYVFESNAIARHLMRMRYDNKNSRSPLLANNRISGGDDGDLLSAGGRRDPLFSHLYGRTPFEASQVDAWVDFATTELDACSTLLIRRAFGTSTESPRKVMEVSYEALASLERRLEISTWLVGERFTYADLNMATTIDWIYRYSPSNLHYQDYLDRFPNVSRHYQSVMNQIPVCEVLKFHGAPIGLSWPPATGNIPALPNNNSSVGGESRDGDDLQDLLVLLSPPTAGVEQHQESSEKEADEVPAEEGDSDFEY